MNKESYLESFLSEDRESPILTHRRQNVPSVRYCVIDDLADLAVPAGHNLDLQLFARSILGDFR